MLRTLLLMVLLVGCDYSFAPSEEPRTPEPPESVEDQVSDYVDTYGGSESQYRVILGSACPELEQLLQRTTEKMAAEQEHSPQWRAALGYANAVNSRQLDLDC